MFRWLLEFLRRHFLRRPLQPIEGLVAGLHAAAEATLADAFEPELSASLAGPVEEQRVSRGGLTLQWGEREVLFVPLGALLRVRRMRLRRMRVRLSINAIEADQLPSAVQRANERALGFVFLDPVLPGRVRRRRRGVVEVELELVEKAA